MVPVDLKASQDELVNLFPAIDIVISEIYFANLAGQVPLAAAAKIAAVK